MIMLFSLVSCAAFIVMLTVYEWEAIKDSFKNMSIIWVLWIVLIVLMLVLIDILYF